MSADINLNEIWTLVSSSRSEMNARLDSQGLILNTLQVTSGRLFADVEQIKAVVSGGASGNSFDKRLSLVEAETKNIKLRLDAMDAETRARAAEHRKAGWDVLVRVLFLLAAGGAGGLLTKLLGG